MNVFHVSGASCLKATPMRVAVAAIALFFLNMPLQAQPAVKPLSIGDKVPEAVMQLPLSVVNHPQGKATLKLADYKDKLIVLDFCATWCTNCARKLPQLYKVQKEMQDSVAALLVSSINTRDDTDKVTAFLKKHKDAYSFPSVVNDSLLMALFPHKTVPHYVLLKNDTVVQIATGEEAADLSVKELIASGGKAVVHRPVYDYNKLQPLFKNGNGGPRPDYVFGSLLTRYLAGVHGGDTRETDSNGLVKRLTHVNIQMIDLFRYAYPQFFMISRARTIFALADTALFSETGSLADTRYTYEMEVPPMPYEQAQQMMQKDLERYYSLSVSRSKQNMPCWVLKAVNPQKALLAAKGQPRETNLYEKPDVPIYYNNGALLSLVNYLEEVNNTPFVDETGITDPVSLKLPANLADISALQDSLAAQGFALVKEKRVMDVVTISDKH